MNYTLNQLQIFLKIVENKSITKAAEELNLTQPAVSIQLKNFQDQFDIPLTEVVGRKIYITDFGKEIAVAAAGIIDQVNAINQKTLSYRGHMTGRLRVSVVSTGKYVMPYFLSGFIKNNPGVDLQMDVTNKHRVIESLENNEVDFALVSILPSKMPVEKIDLLPNKLYLVGKTKVTKQDNSKKMLDGLPLIFREQGSGTRQTMESYIEKHRITVTKKMELTSNEAVKQSLLAGLGYSIMPVIGIRNELNHDELQIIPIEGLPITTTWSIIWLKGKRLSPVATAYIDYLQKEKERIVSDRFGWCSEY